MTQQTTEFPFQTPETATDVWRVTLEMTGRLYGGMNASRESLAKRPWKERNEDLRSIAREVNEGAVPEEAEAGPQQTVFRRTKEGQLALSAGQIRTFLQEVAAEALAGAPNYFVLRHALRRQLNVQPTLIGLTRSEGVLKEPDGIDYIPRPIRRPPFERSVVHEPEFTDGAKIHFSVYVGAFGSGRSITDEVLGFLFIHGGAFVGLGAHRGLTDHEAGKFVVTEWAKEHLRDVKVPAIPASGSARTPRPTRGEKPNVHAAGSDSR